ncbi:sugar ABC transporter ATP-binding protein [Salinisphaera sp. SWV1]|uniref:sugar ABC transporter ATP-binding protein n=1 Tax=Salinisphaera sp. SWV1 TaxID=3454139 RepID=UPI003F87BA0A
MAEHVLELDGVAKRFPPNVVALRQASLFVRPGEVHCLMGANGAGKSTLLKVVAGAHRADEGELRVDGRRLDPRHPQDAARAGIAMIYQELDLVGQMTVEENLMLGRTPQRWGFVSRRARRRIVEEALARVGATFGPEARIESLSIANQQLAAIARALTGEARVVVMDEPSAALNETELARVFEVVREMTAQGVAVVYVSHRLPEIRAIGDRVTVLRNGETVDSFTVAEVDDQALLKAVVGDQPMAERATRDHSAPEQPIALDIRELNGPDGLTVRDLKVRRGEVIGLAGLNGAGRTTLLKALFGALPMTGDVALFEQPYRPRHTRDAIARGVGLVPESRKTEGLVLDSAIYRNASLVSMRHRRLIWQQAMTQQAQPVLDDLKTKYGRLSQPVRQLSGGNQQKVVLAKWVVDGVQLLLLDEPSRGLDVGAKAELYRLARTLAAEGTAVLVASSEFEELYLNCDRIWVMHEGRNVACFDPAVASSDDIQQAIIIGGERQS